IDANQSIDILPKLFYAFNNIECEKTKDKEFKSNMMLFVLDFEESKSLTLYFDNDLHVDIRFLLSKLLQIKDDDSFFADIADHMLHEGSKNDFIVILIFEKANSDQKTYQRCSRFSKLQYI